MAAKKPLLRPANVKARLEFARTHKNWTVDVEQWSDESCFQLFCGIFQHDNASGHNAGKVTDFLECSVVEVTSWPAQSLGLNPIQHRCEVLFRKVNNSKPSNLDGLLQLLSAAWHDTSRPKPFRTGYVLCPGEVPLSSQQKGDTLNTGDK